MPGRTAEEPYTGFMISVNGLACPLVLLGGCSDQEERENQIPEDYEKIDFPSVEYRGIFINDEEELDHWARLHMNEDTIGVHTYEKYLNCFFG